MITQTLNQVPAGTAGHGWGASGPDGGSAELVSLVCRPATPYLRQFDLEIWRY